MPKFSKASLDKLNTCHPDLITLFNTVVQTLDCVILEGYRGKEAQEAAFAAGNTKLHYPNGKHNKTPSLAVDAAPYPLPAWKDIQDFIYFGGEVMGIAVRLLAEGKITHRVRYGGDFNMDNRVTGEKFLDAPHFELLV